MTEKSLFTNKSSQSDTKKYLTGRWWTNEAHSLDKEIKKLIRPIIEEYAFKGFNLREIQYIIANCADGIIIDLCLDDKGQE